MYDGGEQQNSPPFHLLSEHETEILRLFAKERTQVKSQVAQYQPADAAKPVASYEPEAADPQPLGSGHGCDFGLPDKRRGETTVVAVGEFEINDRRVTGDPQSQSNIEVRREVPLKPR
jgi:hypothetical protein